MRRLGLSLYPEHSTLEEDKKYLDTASKLGYSRIFASLLELGDDKDKTQIVSMESTMRQLYLSSKE
ncbi:MupG family TIM beta-alpha barrel fold protein [Oenococcus oeni]|uniref:MupG family TIM beta-alpha barrel fold protein n=1 Tax=Oenococcus oeni TaxID=1247 RepID=UPI0039C991FA